MNRFWKSTLPSARPTGGMMMSFTSLLTTVASASPRMNASASASALDLTRNTRNSDHIERTPCDAEKRGVLRQSPCQPCGRVAERYNLDAAGQALLGFSTLTRRVLIDPERPSDAASRPRSARQGAAGRGRPRVHRHG